MKFFKLASEVAQSRVDERSFLLGAIGVRGDGTIVTARNGAVHSVESKPGWSFPSAHAEARCCKKMDYNGTIYVARVFKKTGLLAVARPCFACIQAIRSRSVRRVYYSIDKDRYGYLNLVNNAEYTENY